MREKPRWKIKKRNAEDCKDQVPVQVQTDEMGEGFIYFLQFDIATWARGISTWLQSKKRVLVGCTTGDINDIKEAGIYIEFVMIIWQYFHEVDNDMKNKGKIF
ncbi:hypothetical protein PV327_000112 [Microctonus hyperodae]|uniref:Uncharacterized protein n=1 Tax=Microctonus hyperodae TaxID=165561 RepID=A0AA39G5I9_MICHY|nr:hypothetical protein PV327_000112 [Microctonus hyperodae]